MLKIFGDSFLVATYQMDAQQRHLLDDVVPDCDNSKKAERARKIWLHSYNQRLKRYD